MPSSLCQVPDNRLLEALLKWDRAKAWPGRGNPNRSDAAPAAMPRKHGPGGPWVAVRAHYGALPSMAGRVLAKGGVTCLDGELARAGAYKSGPKDEEIAAAGRWKAFPWPLFS